MTINVVAGPMDVTGVAVELVAGLEFEPCGRVGPSVYETGRLVALAPWLVGHRQRIEYLLASQRVDGGWGGPGGYALAPTLSALDGLLAAGAGDGVPDAMDRGLATVAGWLRGAGPSLPDLPAVELIVPALIESINAHLDRLQRPRLPHLAALDGVRLAAIRAAVAAGGDAPEKLWHAWEVVGGQAPGVRAVSPGTVGASPAATAAWLVGRIAPDPGDPARRYLEMVARHYGGPVPCAAPITLFERAWVLTWLAQAGIPLTTPTALLQDLLAAVDASGVPAGPGLPRDADTTAVALYALAQNGVLCEPASLWAYQVDAHFCTWQGEDGQSVTVNAHVLEAFGHYREAALAPAPRYAEAVRRLTDWLSGQQRTDGSWIDRWHASPYYATACCAIAMDRFGRGRGDEAVRRAVAWTAATQRPDGSWGLWQGTAEETAYAIRTLLTRPDGGHDWALARGYSYLLDAAGPDLANAASYPAMWHDKDLYSPAAIIQAAVLAALYQAQRHLHGR